MKTVSRIARSVGRFFMSLRLGEDPAGDRLVTGGHARDLNSGLYRTPSKRDRSNPYRPDQADA